MNQLNFSQDPTFNAPPSLFLSCIKQKVYIFYGTATIKFCQNRIVTLWVKD